jgi:hypothetical protein
MRSFMVCTLANTLLQANPGGRDGWQRRKTDAGFWRENLALRGHLTALAVDGTGIKPISKKHDWRAWTGLMWIWLGTGSELL